jgi:hypothetical protein
MAWDIAALMGYFEMNSLRLISLICPCFRGRFEGIGLARPGSNPLKISPSIFDQSNSISAEEIGYFDIFPMFLAAVR